MVDGCLEGTIPEREGILNNDAMADLVDEILRSLEQALTKYLGPDRAKIERTHSVFIPNPTDPDKATILINPFSWASILADPD